MAAYGNRRHAGHSVPPSDAAPVLRVKGCANKMISGIVTGKYVPHASNHGKTVWKRDTRDKDSEVLIYFWDDRDGPELTGWWFGPAVGGDQVWAYHPSRSASIPPEGDWNVPHDGPIDATFRVVKVAAENDRDEAPRAAPRAGERGREADDIRQVEELRRKMEEHKKNEEEIRRKLSEKEQNKSQHDAVQQFKEKLLARALDKNRGADTKPSAVNREPSGQLDKRSRSPLARREARDTKAAPDRQHRQDSRSPMGDRRRQDGDHRRRDMGGRDRDGDHRPRDGGREDFARRDRREEPPQPRRDDRRPGREGDFGRDRVDQRRLDDRKARDDERRKDEEKRRREASEARKDDERRRDRERDDRERRNRDDQDKDRRRHDQGRDDRRPRSEDKEQLEKDEKIREQERKAKEEERRKHEEELERKRALRREQEEEARKKVEEERRRDREKRQREEEELREKERKRKEVEEKQRAEQERQQEEERLRLAAEQQAAVQVLQVLQKLSTASPDSFEELKGELKEVLAEQLPRCGRQEPALKAEAERVVQYVEKYMEQLKEHQKQVEELRIKQEKEMAEKEAKTQQLLAELDELVLDAEDAAVEAFEASGVLENLPDGDCVEVLNKVKDFEIIAKAAMMTCVKCADFMVDRRGEMDEAERLAADVAEYVQGATPRIQGSTRVVAAVTKKCTALKEKAERKLKALKESEAQKQIFEKYDKDKDGHLNLAEAIAYSKGEYGFDPTKELIARFFERTLGPNAKGAELKHLLQLKTTIGVARAEARTRQKRVEQEQKAKNEKEAAEARKVECQKRKEELTPELEVVAKRFKTLEEKVAQLEAGLKELASRTDNTMAEDLLAQLEAARTALKETDEELPEARKAMESFVAVLTATEGLKEFLAPELNSFTKVAMGAEQIRGRAKVMLVQLGSVLKLKAFVDKEAIRMDVAMRVRSCAEEHGHSLKNLFNIVDGDQDGYVSKADILNYLEGFGGRLVPEVLDQAVELVRRLPRALIKDPVARTVPDAESQQAILSAAGAAAAAKSSAPKEDGAAAAASEGATEGQAVEAPAEAAETADAAQADAPASTEAPAEQPAAEGAAPAEQPAAEGAAPANGEEDPANGLLSKEEFQRLLRLHYRVVRQIILSDSLAIQESRQIRRVEIGEVMEVHEGPKMDPVVGVMRVYGCVLKDGMMGWATIAGNQGIIFLVRGGTAFKVLRSVPLSMELKDVEESNAIRMLKVGEVVEVVDWARTSRSALGVSRVCARCQEDGFCGWATLVDSGGAANLEVLA